MSSIIFVCLSFVANNSNDKNLEMPSDGQITTLARFIANSLATYTYSVGHPLSQGATITLLSA